MAPPGSSGPPGPIWASLARFGPFGHFGPFWPKSPSFQKSPSRFGASFGSLLGPKLSPKRNPFWLPESRRAIPSIGVEENTLLRGRGSGNHPTPGEGFARVRDVRPRRRPLTGVLRLECPIATASDPHGPKAAHSCAQNGTRFGPPFGPLSGPFLAPFWPPSEPVG